jgi:hypothetical protein
MDAGDKTRLLASIVTTVALATISVAFGAGAPPQAATPTTLLAVATRTNHLIPPIGVCVICVICGLDST